jgi:hypothetical protein
MHSVISKHLLTVPTKRTTVILYIHILYFSYMAPKHVGIIQQMYVKVNIMYLLGIVNGAGLLTYSTQRSPSWETNRFSASQEIPRILWNPNVHHLIHKSPPPVPIFSQRTRISVHVRDFLCKRFVTRYVFTMRSCLHLAHPPSWRTTPCRLSSTAYSLHSQLPSILEAIPPSATRWRAMPWWQGSTYHGKGLCLLE